MSTAPRQGETFLSSYQFVENYFNYFTEIEEHFRRRRGGAMLLSTLDWALIETWKDAGLPLAAVLRGIDVVFDRYDQRAAKMKPRKVNGLAFCTQEVLQAAEEMKEAAVGARTPDSDAAAGQAANSGFSPQEVQNFLSRSASALDAVHVIGVAAAIVSDAAATLHKLAAELAARQTVPLQEIEHILTALEEKILAALLTAAPHEEMVAAKAEVEREIAPFRRKMQAAQIEQLHRQYLQRRMFDKAGIPRLSLFYM